MWPPDSAFFAAETASLLRVMAGLRVPREEAEEMAQEAWLDAWEHRELFVGAEGERRFHGRMRRVVRNKARDRRRRLDCCRFVTLPVESDELIDQIEEENRQAAEDREWVEAVLAQVRRRSEENHRLLREHYLKGASLKDLARGVGLTEKAVECRMRRELRKLRAAE